MKILITGAFSSLNKGDEARVKSSIKMIRTAIPNTYFGFFSPQPEIDCKIYKDCEIKIITRYKHKYNQKGFVKILKGLELLVVLLDSIFLRFSTRPFSKSLKELRQYDVFMDLSGESLSDYFGQINLFFALYPLMLGELLKKQVIIFAQSIGPFDNSVGRAIARHILNSSDLITVREEKSIEYLRKYNITKPPIYLTADPAFVLCPPISERINEILKAESMNKTDKLIVGLAISRGSFRQGISSSGNLDEKYQEYINVMIKTVDYLAERLSAEIIFIPHVVIPTEDDRSVYKEIYQNVKNKNRFKIVNSDYTPEELKGIIGRCDLFIASRMHPVIAAVSMFVPTVAIAYSHKMPSLMKMLGLERYVCDVMNITFDELISKIEDVWAHREEIKSELVPKIEKMRKDALRNAELVRDLVCSR